MPSDEEERVAESTRAQVGIRALVAELLARLREHPRLGALALLLVCSFAYFVGPPAWNQNSRLALTRALVEHGAVEIDDWHHTTGDKSYRDGHFYSDKAPGVSLLATAPYAGLFVARKIGGGELPAAEVRSLDPALSEAGQAPAPEDREPGDVLVYNTVTLVALWLCRMVVVSLPTVLAGALLYLVMLGELDGDRRAATWVALLWLLATPAFGYACGFYGHQLAGDLLVASFALIVLGQRHALGPGVGLTVGSLLGWAVLVEYTAAVPVLMIVAWAGWRRGRTGGGLGLVAWICAGGLPWAAVLAGYHTWAFGGPLSTGYDFVYLEHFAEGMAVNYGIGWPDPAVLAQLLFGSYRGLFYLSPVLLLAAWGLGLRLVEGVRARRDRSAGGEHPRSLRVGDLILAVAICAYYLVLNSGYYMWDGGAALGPRHAVPMLGFMALGFAPALRRVPGATAALGLISCAQVVVITAAGPEAPSHGNPIWAYAVWRVSEPSAPGSATDLGRLLGLPGALSLIPLLALWVLLWPTRGAPPRAVSD